MLRRAATLFRVRMPIGRSIAGFGPAFLPRENAVVVGSHDGHLRLLSRLDGIELYEKLLPPVSHLSVLPGDIIVASVWGDDQIYGNVDLIFWRPPISSAALAPDAASPRRSVLPAAAGHARSSSLFTECSPASDRFSSSSVRCSWLPASVALRLRLPASLRPTRRSVRRYT